MNSSVYLLIGPHIKGLLDGVTWHPIKISET